MKIVVGTTSPLKFRAVVRAAAKVFGEGVATVIGVDARSGVPPQPVGYVAGFSGALHRVGDAEKCIKGELYVGIENFIENMEDDEKLWCDRAAVVVVATRAGSRHVEFRSSTPVWFDAKYADEASKRTPEQNTTDGYGATIGRCMKDAGVCEDDADWYQSVGASKSREDELVATLVDALRFC